MRQCLSSLRASFTNPYCWIGAALLWTIALPAWTQPIRDPDLWQNLWAGEEMLAGRFPRTNHLSWTAPDQPWTMHETLVSLTYAAVGLDNVGLVRGIIVSACVLLFAQLAWRPKCALATLFAIAWVTPVIVFGRTERALSWGNLFLAATAALLFTARGTWRLAVAALLAALWANIHGSFVVGIFLIFLTDWRWGLAAAGLTLCNPYGFHLWELIVGYGTGAESLAFVHRHVVDPRDPQELLLALYFALAGALLWTGKEWRPKLLWALTCALAVWHWRYCDIVGITLLPFVARRLEKLLPEKPVGHPAWLLAPAFLITALVRAPAPVDEDKFPGGILAGVPRDARLWNDFEIGGWLGYHGIKVFWDSRNDCYPIDVWRDAVQITVGADDWRQTLDARHIDALVTADPEKVSELTANGWKQVHSAGRLTVLTRSRPN